MKAEEIAEEIQLQRVASDYPLQGPGFCQTLAVVEEAFRAAERRTPVSRLWHKIGLDLAIRAIHAYRKRYC